MLKRNFRPISAEVQTALKFEEQVFKKKLGGGVHFLSCFISIVTMKMVE